MNFGMNRSHRHSGPAKAECLIPQMNEERRKRYLLGATTAEAPSRLIGYVSAGGIENMSFKRRENKIRDRRGIVIAIGIAMFLVIVLFWK